MINMKNSPTPLYLTAREAAAELSVSLATLYAYVSRGLVRSEAHGDGRRKRYRAEDIRTLRQRSAGGEARPLEQPAVPIETSVSTITDAGPVYRGVHATALAGAATLERTAAILWAAEGFDPFDRSNLPALTPEVDAAMAATAGARPMSRAISVLALAGDADPRAFNRSAEGQAAAGARAMRLLAATILGEAPSGEPIHMQAATAWAHGAPAAADMLRRAMVLLADHELNPSTWTVRCAASTGLNLYDAVIAGLVALKGPRHGGAGPLAARLVSELARGDAAATIREKVALGETLPGFGHPVYRDGDPRADLLLTALVEAGADATLAREAPAMIADATGLAPNVDYALAMIVRHFAMPPGTETSIFAIARSAGWIAHAMEQLDSRVLIRPRARYVGMEPGRPAAAP
jgi:citrate synthase